MFSKHPNITLSPYGTYLGHDKHNLVAYELEQKIGHKLGDEFFNFVNTPLGVNVSSATMSQNLTFTLAFLLQIPNPRLNVGTIIPNAFMFDKNDMISTTYTRVMLEYFINFQQMVNFTLADYSLGNTTIVKEIHESYIQIQEDISSMVDKQVDIREIEFNLIQSLTLDTDTITKE